MKTGTRYFLAFVGVIVVLIILFALILRSGSNKPVTVPTNPRADLTKLIKSNSEVSVTIQGPLVAEEQRQAVRISVTPSSRQVDILKGYEMDVDKTESFPNTQAAYDALLRSLSLVGFTKAKVNSGVDEVGICPDGRHYSYEAKDNGKSVSRLWSNACNKGGTFAGDGPTVRNLIQAQIPNYSEFTSGVQL